MTGISSLSDFFRDTINSLESTGLVFMKDQDDGMVPVNRGFRIEIQKVSSEDSVSTQLVNTVSVPFIVSVRVNKKGRDYDGNMSAILSETGRTIRAVIVKNPPVTPAFKTQFIEMIPTDSTDFLRLDFSFSASAVISNQ